MWENRFHRIWLSWRYSMINMLLRYMKGYLRIRIFGNAIERFINICSHNGIDIWDLSPHYSGYEMNITIKDFKKLKPVIRKTKTQVKIVNRTGFPFFLHKYNRRKFFFTGFFICLILIHYLSTYVWNVSITGNISYTTENLTKFLEAMDVKAGMKTKDINCSEIVQKIRENYNDIIWVSASVDGTKLIIQVKENEDSFTESIEEINISEEPYDIVADNNCQITKIIIRKGLLNVNEGDLVEKGKPLILGQIPIYNDAGEIINYQYCSADADVYGKLQLLYEDETNKIYHDKDLTGIKKHEYFIQFKNNRIRFGGINNNYENFTEFSKQKTYGNISIGIRSVFPYSPIAKKYTDKELQKILSMNFTHYCNELEKKGVVILKNNVKIDTWSDKAKASGYLTVEMPVGKLQKSQLLEIGEHIDGNDGNNN